MLIVVPKKSLNEIMKACHDSKEFDVWNTRDKPAAADKKVSHNCSVLAFIILDNLALLSLVASVSLWTFRKRTCRLGKSDAAFLQDLIWAPGNYCLKVFPPLRTTDDKTPPENSFFSSSLIWAPRSDWRRKTGLHMHKVVTTHTPRYLSDFQESFPTTYFKP